MNIKNTLRVLFFEYPFLIISFLLNLILIYHRLPFEESILGLSWPSFISLFLVFYPLLLSNFCQSYEKLKWICPSQATLFMLIAIYFFGILFPTVGILAFAFSFVLFAKNSFKSLFVNHLLRGSFPTYIFLFFAYAISLMLAIFYKEGWFIGYFTPFFKEDISINELDRDVTSMIAYATLFKEYGIFGAGIHGLIEMKYHLAGNLFYVALSNLTKINLSYLYNYVHVIVIVPVFAQSIYSLYIKPLLKSQIQAVFAFFLFVILWCGFWGENYAYIASFYHSIASSTFTFGLWFLLLHLSVVKNIDFSQKFTLHLSKNFISYLSLFTLTALTTYAKVSVGYTLVGILGCFIIFKRFRNLNYFFFLCINGLVSILVLKNLASMNKEVGLGWFYYVNKYFPEDILKFISFYDRSIIFLIIAFFIFKLLKSNKNLEFKSLTSQNYLFFATLFSLIVTWPSIHIAFATHSSLYFLVVGKFLSFFAACYLLIAYVGASKLSDRFYTLSFVILTFLSLPRALDYLIPLTTNLAKASTKKYQQVQKRTDIESYLSYLKVLREIKNEKHTESLLYIPQSEKDFWMYNHIRIDRKGNQYDYWKSYCQELPLLAFVESGLPLIYGLHTDLSKCGPEEMNMWLGVNYMEYFKDYINDLPSELPSNIICKEITRFNMNTYILLKRIDNKVITKKISCQ